MLTRSRLGVAAATGSSAALSAARSSVVEPPPGEPSETRATGPCKRAKVRGSSQGSFYKNRPLVAEARRLHKARVKRDVRGVVSIVHTAAREGDAQPDGDAADAEPYADFLVAAVRDPLLLLCADAGGTAPLLLHSRTGDGAERHGGVPDEDRGVTLTIAYSGEEAVFDAGAMQVSSTTAWRSASPSPCEGGGRMPLHHADHRGEGLGLVGEVAHVDGAGVGHASQMLCDDDGDWSAGHGDGGAPSVEGDDFMGDADAHSSQGDDATARHECGGAGSTAARRQGDASEGAADGCAHVTQESPLMGVKVTACLWPWGDGKEGLLNRVLAMALEQDPFPGPDGCLEALQRCTRRVAIVGAMLMSLHASVASGVLFAPAAQLPLGQWPAYDKKTAADKEIHGRWMPNGIALPGGHASLASALSRGTLHERKQAMVAVGLPPHMHMLGQARDPCSCSASAGAHVPSPAARFPRVAGAHDFCAPCSTQSSRSRCSCRRATRCR